MIHYIMMKKVANATMFIKRVMPCVCVLIYSVSASASDSGRSSDSPTCSESGSLTLSSSSNSTKKCEQHSGTKCPKIDSWNEADNCEVLTSKEGLKKLMTKYFNDRVKTHPGNESWPQRWDHLKNYAKNECNAKLCYNPTKKMFDEFLAKTQKSPLSSGSALVVGREVDCYFGDKLDKTGQWYSGRITKADSENDEFEVNFEHSKDLFNHDKLEDLKKEEQAIREDILTTPEGSAPRLLAIVAWMKEHPILSKLHKDRLQNVRDPINKETIKDVFEYYSDEVEKEIKRLEFLATNGILSFKNMNELTWEANQIRVGICYWTWDDLPEEVKVWIEACRTHAANNPKETNFQASNDKMTNAPWINADDRKKVATAILAMMKQIPIYGEDKQRVEVENESSDNRIGCFDHKIGRCSLIIASSENGKLKDKITNPEAHTQNRDDVEKCVCGAAWIGEPTHWHNDNNTHIRDPRITVIIPIIEQPSAPFMVSCKPIVRQDADEYTLEYSTAGDSQKYMGMFDPELWLEKKYAPNGDEFNSEKYMGKSDPRKHIDMGKFGYCFPTEGEDTEGNIPPKKVAMLAFIGRKWHVRTTNNLIGNPQGLPGLSTSMFFKMKTQLAEGENLETAAERLNRETQQSKRKNLAELMARMRK